jgi:hypothetical protein
MPNADVRVTPGSYEQYSPVKGLVKGEDYSEFLICMVGQLWTASVGVQRNAALARQAVAEEGIFLVGVL